MNPSSFTDKSRKPTDEDLALALGRSHRSWVKLLAAFTETYAPLTATWKFPGKKYGWTLQLKRKSRSLYYMTPHERFFIAATSFGEKAVAVARKSGLDPVVWELIEAAPRFAEGRAIRMEIRRLADLDAILLLAAIKMSV